MNLTRRMAAGALSLFMVAGTAAAQQQWDDQFRHGWGQERDQFTVRGFEADQRQWRTTTRIPQLRGVEATLAQVGEEHDTFVRIEDGEIVGAYVDGRPVPRDHVQVRGNRVRIIDHQRRDIAAIFRIPTPAQVMRQPERFRAMPEPFERDRFEWDGPQMREMERPMRMERHRDMMHMDQRFDRPRMRERMFGTPEAPVADTRTSAVGILMLEARPHHLRGTDYRTGIYIDAVQEGMPAHRAGLRRGDIVVAVEGREEVTPERLKRFLRQVPPGERLEFTIIRDRQERDITVRTTEMLPAKTNWDYMITGLDDTQLRRHQAMLERQRQIRALPEGRILGFGLTEADEDDLADLEEYDRGLEVTHVTPGTILHQAGLRSGDFIVAADDETELTREEFKEILEGKEPGDTLRLRVIRNGQEGTLRVPIQEQRRRGFDW